MLLWNIYVGSMLLIIPLSMIKLFKMLPPLPSSTSVTDKTLCVTVDSCQKSGDLNGFMHYKVTIWFCFYF